MLLVGLVVAVWLAGRWMVAPLARLSAQVDKVAGGDLDDRCPAQPDRRDRQHRTGGRGHDGRARRDRPATRRSRRGETVPRHRASPTTCARPLFALRGHLQAIGSRLGDPSVHLERAEARADALERLVGNLFAYTRDDYAQPAPQLEAALVADLLRGGRRRPRAREPACTATPSSSTATRRSASIVDRDRVKRALTNVLDNALRYSPSGAPIQLGWAARDASTVEVTVRDRGPGIDADLLPHIFEAGIRGTPAAGRPDGGAGLGLTIAKRLLEHQHATLTVHNRSTGGATISIVLERSAPIDPT